MFYSKNGTFALGLHSREQQRGAAAQILREKLRRMQPRRAVQADGAAVLTQLHTELSELFDVTEPVFKDRLGKGRLSLRAQLRGEQDRHRVGRKAGIRP